jgi:hypothetical protein
LCCFCLYLYLYRLFIIRLSLCLDIRRIKRHGAPHEKKNKTEKKKFNRNMDPPK